MKKIWKYLWKYKILIFIGTFTMLGEIILDMFNPKFSAMIIDDVIYAGKRNLLKEILVGLLVVSILRAILIYIKGISFDVLSAKVNKGLKMDLFNHIQSLSFSYFDGMNTGELMSRMSEDVDNIWMAVSFVVMLTVQNGLYFIIASVILLKINWKLALVSIATTPFLAVLAVKLEKEIDESYEKLSDQGALMNTTAQENIAGVRLVKAFAREKHEILKFLDMNNTNYDLAMKQTGIWAKYFPVIEFLTNMISVVIISCGGLFIIGGKMSIGTLVAFNGYLWMLINPMKNVGWLANMLSQARASIKKIDKIMTTKPEIKDGKEPYRLSSIDKGIKFENVSFKYNDEYVLKNINLDIKPGMTVAIMGATGAGKSSLISLIGRYYDVTDGKILVDGCDIRDISVNDLRDKMAVVAQDNFLFSDTIAENVRMGKDNATMDEVRKACRLACADEFINELEDGYDSVIGERGIGLSGGQKQRISIARALIKNADIQIFDDATSALDMETEYELLKNLSRRKKKAITFIIAHRISAVKNADEILYLENGEIVERGVHNELLKKHGRYYDIYCDQFKQFDDAEEVI